MAAASVVETVAVVTAITVAVTAAAVVTAAATPVTVAAAVVVAVTAAADAARQIWVNVMIIFVGCQDSEAESSNIETQL